jgi:ribosome-binding protein aMBF1 (putative translation factor)
MPRLDVQCAGKYIATMLARQQEISLPFGQALKAARKAAKLTRNELAAKAGISARQIGNVEREVSMPRRDTWEHLRKALPKLPTWR